MSASEGPRLYEMLAQAFVAEGVDTLFALMGDGNMHWGSTMSNMPGVRVFNVRHEHCACAMAIGHYSATGKPSVASITCGPGLTQITTALASAVHARVPLVVFAGESPLNHTWHNQMIDQGPIVTATGAHYVRAHSLKRMADSVREAFYVARHERRPVVLGIPYDLQQQRIGDATPYTTSDSLIPGWAPTIPHPADITALSRRLAAAERPVILAGRGVMHAGAEAEVATLAELSGALLATTLPGRGMFDGNPFSIGVAGGFATPIATQLFGEADLILAVGASLTHHTVDGGNLFPKAQVIQIDERPLGLRHGRRAADLYLRADAKLAAHALADALAQSPRTTPGFRSPAIAARIEHLFEDKAEFPMTPGTLDPRQVVEALDRAIPKDWDIVSGSGHSSYFYTHMRHRRPENFHVIREFGAIGNGISVAIGVAATKGNGKVVLLEGDGSLMMHIQELETVRRHGIKLLICALNDGGFGAEFHKLRADGVDETPVIFGRPDFGSIAKGFGLRGDTIADLSGLDRRIADYSSQGRAEIWDFPISDQVVSPRMRNFNSRKH